MAIVHGKEGVIKAGGSVISDVTGFGLETTGDVVETTALETDITRSSNALDTEVVQVATDEGTLFPVGGIRMVVRCMYKYNAGTP